MGFHSPYEVIQTCRTLIGFNLSLLPDRTGELRRGAEEVPRQPSRFIAEIPIDLLETRGVDNESSLSEGDRKVMRQNFFAQMREMLG